MPSAVVVCAWASLLAGCSQPGPSATGGKDAVGVSQGSGPRASVAQYLEAVRIGDAATVNQLLTSRARQKTAELKVAVAPPGSDTAQYEVGQVRYLSQAQDTAHVASRWTDLDDKGQPQSFDVTWIMRQEPDGWRVVGMMGQFIEDQPLMVFNFEDPVEVLRRQTHAQEELARRAAGQRQVQADQADTSRQ
ncbi:MAG: hypothetical protein GTO62_20010 [Planctomycetales bacterium]|nr:hypothetical protein [Planctomycetales bacterium]